MKRKNLFWIVSLLLTVMLILAACGGDEPAPTEPAAEEAAAATPTAEEVAPAEEEAAPAAEETEAEAAMEEEASGDVVELRMTWYTDGNEDVVMRDLLDRFEADNPDIKVVMDNVAYNTILENLPIQLAAGEGPDMARVTDLGGLSKYYLDMSPNLNDTAYWEENFGPFLNWLRPPGDSSIPGFMTQLTVTGPYINKTLFDQAGIEVPTGDVTWEEWAEVTRQVAEATGTDFAMAMDRTGHRFAGPAISQGAKYFDDSGYPAIDDEGFRAMSQLLIDWHNDGTMPIEVWAGSTGYAPANELFVNGQVVLYMSGSWQIGQFSEQIGDAFDWQVIPNPCGPGACSGMPGGAALVAIKDTEHPAEVARVMEYLSSTDVLEEFSAKTLFIPGHLGLSESGVEFDTDLEQASNALSTFVGQVGVLDQTAFDLQAYGFNRVIFDATRDRLTQAILGELTLDEAIERIQSDIDQALGEAGAETTEATDTGSGEAVELRMTWYTDGNEDVVMRELLDKFEAENPNITVVMDNVAYNTILENLPIQLAAGEGPDIARVTDLGGLSEFYLDMSPYLSDTAYWEESFGPFLNWLRPVGDETAINGFMTQLTVTGPYINKTLFDQAGIEVPTGDVTWEEWADVTRQVAEATGTDFAMAMDRTGHRFAGPAISQGAKYFDDSGYPAIDDEGFRAMSQLLIDWHNDGTMPLEVWAGSTGYAPANELFVNGQVVMYMSGSWQIGQFSEQIGDAFDWEVVPNPCGPGACSGMPGGAALVAIKDTEHPEEVAKVMEFLASEDVLDEFSAKTLFIPGHLGLAQSGVAYETDLDLASNALSTFVSQVGVLDQTAFDLQAYPFNRVIFDATRDRLTQAILGELTLDEAVERIQSDVDQALAEAGVETADAGEAMAEGEAVELRMTWYTDGNEDVVMRDLLDRFEADNPDITVVMDNVAYNTILENLPIQLAAGEGPDIARVTDLGGLSEFYLDMAPYLSDTSYWEDNFGPFLNWLRPPGDSSIPGFMTQLTVTGPYINKTLFDQAGIEVPTGDVTWEEWADVTRQVAEATGTDFAMAMDRTGHRFAGPAISQGAKYFDDSGYPAIDDEGFRTMAQLLIDWHNDGTMPLEVWAGSTGYAPANELFVNGQVVLYMSGSWQIGQFSEQIGDAFDWQVIPNPCGPGACSGMPGGAALVAIKDTEHPEQVARVMEYLSSPDVLEEFSARTLFIPGHLGLSESGVAFETDLEQASNALSTFVGQVGVLDETAFNLQAYAFNRVIFDATRDRLTQAILGELTLDEAIERIQSDVDQALAEAGQ